MIRCFLIVFVLCFLSFSSFSQKKWWHTSDNDVAVMSIELVAGYAQGWRDEVIYHPNQMFRRFPNLNRDFWDIRIQNEPTFLNTEWDADHVLKFTVNALHVVGVVVKSGDWKEYRKKDLWKKILFDVVKFYGAYKVGFFLSYNVTHGNKL